MINTKELSDEKRAELISECEELKEEISLNGESAEKRVVCLPPGLCICIS